MILFHSLHIAPKQDYLHSIHFHFFPFLYFKTSNQGYLISFHSIPFPCLNPFHSFNDHSIPLLYKLPSGALKITSPVSFFSFKLYIYSNCLQSHQMNSWFFFFLLILLCILQLYSNTIDSLFSI